METKWKIFRRIKEKNKEDTLFSMSPPQGLKFTYNNKEWNEAPIGGFLVFDTFEYAENYTSWELHEDYILKEVEVKENVRLPELRLTLDIKLKDGLVKNLWNYVSIDVIHFYRFYGMWPLGTKAYKYLRVL